MIIYKRGFIWFDAKDVEKIPYGKVKKYKDHLLMYPYEFINLFPYKDIEGIEFLGAPIVKKNVELRPYQYEAFERWLEIGNGKGIIIMPTGAGKTHIAIYAIQNIKKSALCVVPTIALLEQWVSKLNEYFEDIGVWYGERKELRPITVSTYQSASISAEYLGNKFEFLIFDEVHHLPAESYRKIAEFSLARFRLGLTSTLEREDNLHIDVDKLIGKFKFTAKYEDIKDFLADWEIKTIRVNMKPDKVRRYKELMAQYRNFCLKCGLQPGNKNSFLQVIRMSYKDPTARQALLAHNEARRIATNADEKVDIIRDILKKHPNDKILIFTDTQEFAYRISKEFFVPVITSEISPTERSKYLSGFSEGRYRVIVSAHVLDEGIDVPEASVAIIASGSSSPREFIQRLGRILRPSKPNAILYEIVSHFTSEVFSSRMRKRTLINSN